MWQFHGHQGLSLLLSFFSWSQHWLLWWFQAHLLLEPYLTLSLKSSLCCREAGPCSFYLLGSWDHWLLTAFNQWEALARVWGTGGRKKLFCLWLPLWSSCVSLGLQFQQDRSTVLQFVWSDSALCAPVTLPPSFAFHCGIGSDYLLLLISRSSHHSV